MKNPDYSIKIKIKKVEGNESFDEGSSKFFGNPTLPESLMNKFDLDYIFLCQIRCKDLKDFDLENRIPHEGYLYFFLDTINYPLDMVIVVNHTLEEPKYIVDDFNLDSSFDGDLSQTYRIEFEHAQSNCDGTKLLGNPSGWVDENDDKDSLLLQYDPLDFNIPFLEFCDGYAYVFYKNKKFKEIVTNFEVLDS